MRRIDFVTLKLFVAIADERSLTKAAEREHLALAAVSKRVSDLENQLGIALLYRQPKGVELTPAGHALLHHARNMMDNLAQMNADLSEFSEGVKGHVRIHANTSAVIEFLPEDLSAFTRLHPQVKIDLEERVSSEAIRAVHEGLTDIGIFAGHVPADELQVFNYRHDRLVLVTPRAHPLAERSRISLHEAVSYDFIGLQQDASLHGLLQQAARHLGTPLRLRIQVRSFEAICRMIHTGMGIGILPELAVRTYLPALDVQVIALDDPWARRELKIAVRSLEALSMTARQMLEHLMSSEQREASMVEPS
ncbi:MULTISPECIES: LysR family transcriptional regulator [unclassified Pseudomonas]|jgi:DNA-binding transcriptional LysR family regulator|uniref:LysR family transcriptional regulator n=1 Tax=unclassified Pseudomonas TaxID=196821 RepID=UPI00136DB7CC|nr:MULTISPECIES: LysR family transcriptional regulator [unclassified Pseudomonas]MBD0701477.1 LysR family transcriptional regulator [Pseudomonas sp. PSB1]MDR8384557.1 LysR family transcriptional regulator [Pseudomonas sp. JL2]MXR29914.1 LysR family transcriptional regulator [Pseudomonas sp. PICF6]QKJ35650.1 LysR family transcriptional regulator [Pseudomonas sp. MPDS]WNZ76208.1 LysR family transcriptional regulator [Pseudomonas sp. P105]